jgi:hypothetical protein
MEFVMKASISAAQLESLLREQLEAQTGQYVVTVEFTVGESSIFGDELSRSGRFTGAEVVFGEKISTMRDR